MLIHDALYLIARLTSYLLLPLLYIAGIGLVFAALYDIVMEALSHYSFTSQDYSQLALIHFADPLHVLIAAGASIFFLVVSSGTDSK